MITQEELDFLRESNNIEDVWDDLALQDAVLAWQYILGQEDITIDVVLETHRILMRNRMDIDEEDKGNWRTCDVMIGGRLGKNWVALPEIMPIVVKRLSQTAKLRPSEKDTEEDFQNVAEEHTKTDHVYYESIHPFIDGNGRTGRIFMNWQRVKLGLPVLVIKEKEKMKYYKWFETKR